MYLQLKFGGKKSLQLGRNGAADAPAAEVPAPPTITAAPVAPAATALRPRLTNRAPQIKTYVAESVPHAMSLARREMGEDAILIQTKRNESGDASRRFEVTFGIVPGDGVAAPIASLARAETATDSASASTDIGRQLGSLRSEVAALQTMLRQSALVKQAAEPDNVAASEVYAVLLGNDVDDELALELVSEMEPCDITPRELLGEQLAKQIVTDSSIGEGGKAVVLMGPPGSGKTTALIKLAVEYGLKRGNAIQIFCMSAGTATVDRTLESLTAILGVPCEALPNAAALASALDRPRAEGTVVLVDVNGYGLAATSEEMELASVLSSGEKVDVHLVIPAAWHRVSIRRIVDRFEIFQPARLLFTMVDQAAVYGPLVQEAWRTQKPISFISTGKVGSTLRPADLEWIVDCLYKVAQDICSGSY